MKFFTNKYLSQVSFNITSFRHRRNSLGDTFLIILNITDLLICGFAMTNCLYYSEYVQKLHNAMNLHWSMLNWLIFICGPLDHLDLFSCFITLLLSITRTMVMRRPHKAIRKRLIFLAIGIFIVFLLAVLSAKSILLHGLWHRADNVSNSEDHHKKMAIKLWTYLSLNISHLFITCMIVLLVSFSYCIATRRLKKTDVMLRGQKRSAENRGKATRLILTLSIFFVICNGVWCIMSIVLITRILVASFTSSEEEVKVFQVLNTHI